ncbi:MAG: beta-ketoacyl-[acyl-carrier-protein] synthase family protein [Myxococcales bacterium]|nr:beta-ketoacyl-[acyl-carrier-protein] synthase family protein [Myxococcales bacterium]
MAIRGIGVVSALGEGREALSHALRSASCGVTRHERFAGAPFTSAFAGAAGITPREDVARDVQLAREAAARCIADAGVEHTALRDVAVVLGVGAGGGGEPIELRDPPVGARLLGERPARVTDIVADELGFDGPRLSLMTACSSSATALGVALDLLRSGRARWALAGGVEPLSRLTYGGFSALRALDPAPCRPFDRTRAGLNLGEAAAMMLLERADVLAPDDLALLGYGTSADAHHMTAPHPEGRGAAAAMSAALRDAGLAPAQVDYVNAHGTATQRGDAAEAAALRTVFGDHPVVVSSTKGATGHTLGAAGALECSICAVALREGFFPPTVGLESLDACADGLDIVRGAAREGAPRVALSNSFAFGGTNTSVVLGAWS